MHIARRLSLVSALAGALLVTAAGPAPAQGPAGGITSPNLEHVGLYPLDGRANGGKLLDRYLYVTTGKTLEILDISEPTAPQRVGTLNFELLDAHGLATGYQEDLDTNGKVLIRSESGILDVVDVSDVTKPTVIGSVEGADDHTMTCVLDCTWVYGSDGAIVDIRNPSKPVVIDASWNEALEVSSSHDVTEVAPGIVLTGTQPMYLLDVRTDPVKPKVLAKTDMPGFVHGVLWPHLGTDRLALGGGEALGPGPLCETDPSSTFFTMDTTDWQKTKSFKVLDTYELRTGDEGSTTSLFCTHWFDHHPGFGTGGLVTVAWYENGLRLLSVDKDGIITSAGYFLPHGGNVFDVRWITDRVVYSLDHYRGIDILRYTGDIPPSNHTPPAGGSPFGGSPSASPTPAPAGPGPSAAPPAGSAKPSFTDVATLASSKRCLGKKTVLVKPVAGAKIRQITVKAGSKVLAKVTGAKTVRLKRLPGGKKLKLRVEIVTEAGDRLVATRSFKRC